MRSARRSEPAAASRPQSSAVSPAERGSALINGLILAALLSIALWGLGAASTWRAAQAGSDSGVIALQTASQPTEARFDLAARISMTHGFIKQADWLDNDSFLTLLLSPDGASVWQTDFNTLERIKFISSSFLEEHICSAELAPRLSWTLSPGKRYLFFNWFLDDGSRRWALLDISAAPQFKLRKFSPPAGMQISRVLFSPDDRYAVFIHDAFIEGSEASLLVLDLQAGSEIWRIGTQELNFPGEIWWGGAIYDTPRFNVMAKLYNGQFQERPGQALCDIKQRTISFTPDDDGLMFGADTLWGKVSCHAKGEEKLGPYYLAAVIPGQQETAQIALSSQPVRISALPEPGLVLISNTMDFVINQLWLIDVVSGDKHEIDEDCADYSVAADGKLLVRAKTANELRVYGKLPGADPTEP